MGGLLSDSKKRVTFAASTETTSIIEAIAQQYNVSSSQILNHIVDAWVAKRNAGIITDEDLDALFLNRKKEQKDNAIVFHPDKSIPAEQLIGHNVNLYIDQNGCIVMVVD